MLQRTAHWCRVYRIPVSRTTTLSHAEVQRNLGIRQRNKWDFTVLPGMTAVADPVMIGDRLRARLTEMLAGQTAPAKTCEIEPAIPASERVRITTFGSYLNLRRWPSFADNVIATIPGGAVVPVQRRGTFAGTAWVCVNHDGREGWVVSSFTKPA
ncbi:MAG: SH3 domain-containing protein [Alphaproteobacteria bacterium]|nr:SH3 domain-containing protein [Alphaproteobacteria bacterium]